MAPAPNIITHSKETPPMFTADDEMQELATLSLRDIERSTADLLGVTAGVANLGLENKGGRQSDAALLRLDAEISKIPHSQKLVFLEAQAKCPTLVNDTHRKAILQSEEFDEKRAARRLVKYWDHRRVMFGPEKCFLPLTLHGALKDDFVALSHCIYRLLPCPDQYGRRIIFFDVRYTSRSHQLCSIESMIRAAWYTLEVALEDPGVRENGLVIIDYPRHGRADQLHPKFPRALFKLISIIPLSLRSIHLCHPAPFVYYVAGPIIKFLMGKQLRLRLRIHSGSEEKVLNDLSTYGVPRDRVPREIGGDVVIDQEKWLKDRVLLERNPSFTPWWGMPLVQRADQTSTRFLFGRINATEAGEGVESDGQRAVKKPRSEQSDAAVVSQNVSCAPKVIIVRPGVKSKHGRKGRGSAKQGDPRMNRAVEAKLETPNLSHYDALLAGGFIFVEDPNAGVYLSDKEIFDAENVSLVQRKNQLGRRVRKALKERGADSARSSVGVSSNRSQVDANHAPQDTIAADTSVCSKSYPDAPTEPCQSVDARRPNSLKGPALLCDGRITMPGQCTDPSGGCDNGRDLGRRDSFYDSILELPGIDDLGMGQEEHLWP